ncbi:MAG TPA: YraN family protein, partial [Thauera aminoaromatica]|nr:YraN family protein [Thauera aminoaromatica]
DSIGARPTPAQARGAAAEALAAEHLAAHGLRVIARNVRCRGGEVDLVCLDRSHVVFVEVRLRRNNRFGGAAESITAAKQRRVLIAAQWWLGGAGRRFRDAACRFDAVLLDALDPARIIWLPGAFDAG